MIKYINKVDRATSWCYYQFVVRADNSYQLHLIKNENEQKLELLQWLKKFRKV